MIRYALISLLALISINAFGGALYGLSGAPELPKEWLDGSPFATYTIPSLVLGIAVGGTHLAAFIMNLRSHPSATASAFLAAAVLATWIVVQVAIIGYVSALQPVMFAAAVITGLLAARRRVAGAVLGPESVDQRPSRP